VSHMRLFLSLVLYSVFVIGCATMEDSPFDDIDTVDESAIVEDSFDTGNSVLEPNLGLADEPSTSQLNESAPQADGQDAEYPEACYCNVCDFFGIPCGVPYGCCPGPGEEVCSC
jgi:hypothetical protein